MGRERRMQVIFCLASGRSGTRFLSELVRRHTRRVVCRHEPYGRNPSMFGRPIYDLAVGDAEARRALLKRKCRVIGCFRSAAAYLETSHAFLKSWSDLAPEFFPDMKAVRLIRNPLEVARSGANREDLLQRWHFPRRTYRGGDGRPYFRWSLTGLEPIFAPFAAARLSRFQWHALQWIEIENRAARFLSRTAPRVACFTLESPGGLNDPGQIERLLQFLEAPRAGKGLRIDGRRNRTPGTPTVVGALERREFEAVLAKLPSTYLEPFSGEPYARWPFRGPCAASGWHSP